jgi:hypothetical protein
MAKRGAWDDRLERWGARLGELVRRASRAVVHPVVRMWGADALVVVALADSVFFSLPVGQARSRVALYLAVTMAPLAVAGPLLVPLLDRSGFRRAISFAAAGLRAVVAMYAAPRVGSVLLFPAAFVLLALSKAHGLTKNDLTLAYAGPGQGLVQANGRLGRVAATGALVATVPGLLALKTLDATAVLYLAAAVYGVTALLTLRLPQPPEIRVGGTTGRLGRVPELALPALGTAGLRAASGFLLFLLAFALRRAGRPPYWFGLLAVGGAAGGYLADLVAPRLPRSLREEAVVLIALVAAGGGAVLAFVAFSLPALVLFALLAGAAAEFGRLAFQSLMQRLAPSSAQGRVFVRYEVQFQLAWVGAALVPALVPLPFRSGLLVLAALYGVLTVTYLRRRRSRLPAA